METRLVHDIGPTPGNPRNSEGAFLRIGSTILFAYSRYTGNSWNDHAACDIALIRSEDEGETWSQPEIIAEAAAFGTQNIMSVSSLTLLDGSYAFFFLIKENDRSTTIGRAVTRDGITFEVSRCRLDLPAAYYVINNDRFERLSDGRIAAPAAYIPHNTLDDWKHTWYVSVVLYSSDDGATFTLSEPRLTIDRKVSGGGLQEPGVIELAPGVLWLWARTSAWCQYESLSADGGRSFTAAAPSRFTSPNSPMEVRRMADGTLLAVYNPIPAYNGRKLDGFGSDRTPLVLRKSVDNGASWGPCNVIEEDPARGYCYPAIFETADGHVLVAYCRGSKSDGACLCRTGISKIKMDTVE